MKSVQASAAQRERYLFQSIQRISAKQRSFTTWPPMSHNTLVRERRPPYTAGHGDVGATTSHRRSALFRGGLHDGASDADAPDAGDGRVDRDVRVELGDAADQGDPRQ